MKPTHQELYQASKNRGKLPKSYFDRIKGAKKEKPEKLPEIVSEEQEEKISKGTNEPMVEVQGELVGEKDESKDNDFESLPEGTEFPYNYGGSHYFLSNGEKVQGKQLAQAKQDELNGAK